MSGIFPGAVCILFTMQKALQTVKPLYSEAVMSFYYVHFPFLAFLKIAGMDELRRVSVK